MSGIKIRGTGRFAPAKIVTNDDLAKIVDTSDEWITTRTGIQTRHHCTTETHTDMCVGAARQALENAGISPEDIGACVVATFSSDYLSPSAACMVQRGLGLPHDAVCFDLNAACSGFLFAIHTMECLLAQAPRKYGLVIGAEMLSRFINWEDRGTCVLFGDGAGAVVVEWRARPPDALRCACLHPRRSGLPRRPGHAGRHRRGETGAGPHLHARPAHLQVRR